MSDGPWLLGAASAIGSSHLDSGVPCQDAFASIYFENADGCPHYAIAVSDGAGSASHAREAADIAVQTVLECLPSRLGGATQICSLGPEVVPEVIGHVQTCLHDATRAADTELREFACTLLVAIVNLQESLFIQLGDGAIVFSRVDTPGEYELAFWPDTGEYANVTNFLSDDDAVFTVRSRVDVAGTAELAVFTDGLQRIVLDYESRQPFKPFFGPVFGQLHSNAAEIDASLQTFLESERIGERTDDDRTLVLLARNSVPPRGSFCDVV